MSNKRLLAVFELGGYPNFESLYRRLGYRMEVVTSGRKATAFLKKSPVDVIVAEFNFQPNFRDRTSNLESILATAQRHPGIKVVVFYEPEHLGQLDRLRTRFTIHGALPYPITEAALEGALLEL